MRWSDGVRAALCALLVGACLSACTIGRRYTGVEIRDDPTARIQPGSTTRAEVLAIFGPPDRILRQTTGDVFVYRFERRNSTSFTLEEPIVTDMEIFSWNKVQEKSDQLTVFFDREGIVTGFGYRRGTEELDAL
jgi:outer membrane protein assembly factor BamE (lipoprotein component of BamABCDE complex)